MDMSRITSLLTRKQRLVLTAALAVVFALTQPGVSSAAASSAAPPADIFHLTARQFEEPFLPTAPTSSREDAALREAIARYEARTAEDDFGAFNDYLTAFPRSGWRVAILTNLGLSYYHYGYFSKAIDSWEKGWHEGSGIEDPHVKPMVDRAIGELFRMHARLGHAERLQGLFNELNNREVTGPATEAVAGAREGLWMMQHDPGVAYLCGPMALRNMLVSQGAQPDNISFLESVRSGPNGVSLQEVGALADKAKLSHALVFRRAGQEIPVPSIIHWKVNHFAAIVGKQDNRFHIKDPTFGTDLWVTRAAIDAEGSGYFLIPASAQNLAWRSVSNPEASRVRGMGYTGSNDASATTNQDDTTSDDNPNTDTSNDDNNDNDATTGDSGSCGMCTYSITEMLVSVRLTDTPVGYRPPRGPAMLTTLTYNQREASQPATFSWFNVSPKWSLNWLSYIQDDPIHAGSSVNRIVGGGGSIAYDGFNINSGAFTQETRNAALLVRTSASPITYERRRTNGGVEIFSLSNGAKSYPRRVFLTKIIDPAGNSLTLNYDNQYRLISITDATGRSTTFTYGLQAAPLLITAITDPFGRSAKLTYDAKGRLSTITDVLGLVSQFTYDSASLINALTTPYGTTSFTYGANGNQRFAMATDPLGHTERVEYAQGVASIPFSDPVAKIPGGIQQPFNQYLNGRNTYYWNKHAYAVGAGDYTKARIKHWTHLENNTNVTANTVESIKNPLENRIWFNYPGQVTSPTRLGTAVSGTLDKRTGIGRVLDDGSTQFSQYAYNTSGKLAYSSDPVGRTYQFIYDGNGIDLLTVQHQTFVPYLRWETIAQTTYNDQHLPLTTTDAAGQTTTYTYNDAGQPLTVTDALGHKRSFSYDGLGYLLNITNANEQTQASFTYDGYGRVATRTDSEGYSVAYQYDSFDRPTLETYPDGTTRRYAYDRLDLSAVTDRQGRTTLYSYDGNRELTQITDPLRRATKFGYFENAIRKSLTDPNGNTTNWAIDIQNRVTGKTYADGKGTSNAYEATTPRLKSVTDALGQVKQYGYTQDDLLARITYSHPVNPTPNLSWTYDPEFPRPVSMTDGSGTTQYRYIPVGSVGALQLSQEDGPYNNDTITYDYDALGRLVTRTVAGVPETFSYDSLNRLTTQANALGTFDLTYSGQTGQLTSQRVRGGVVGTTWSYDTNYNDRRLKAITNSGSTRSYQFTTTPESLISKITEVAGPGSPFPSQTWSYTYDDSDRLTEGTSSLGKSYRYGYDQADNIIRQQTPNGSITHGYNDLNQITSDSYDANGNLIDDGQRTYSWDAENRLLSVTSKAQAQKATSFRYDGLDRRIAIVTNGTEVRYLWCGEQMCQARSSADLVIRRYFDQGEFIPTGGTQLYYAQDQLGSVRDVVAVQNGARVASYDYEPYGSSVQMAGRVGTDLRYAGMLYEPSSDLLLTHYRGYKSSIGAWISRDPLTVSSSPSPTGASVYGYALDNPLLNIDPKGLQAAAACILGPNPVCAVGVGQTAVTVATVVIGMCSVAGSGRNPGDCSSSRQQYLQAQVNNSCKPTPPACVPYESCSSMNSKMQQFSSCASARQTINNECYRGGDKGHQIAYTYSQQAAATCQGLLPTCTP